MVECRLYYDSAGRVLFYTCEKPEGNYIVVDALTYAASRLDVVVYEGKIVPVSELLVWSKLVPSDVGTACAVEDISIIVPDNELQKQKWNVKSYALKR